MQQITILQVKITISLLFSSAIGRDLVQNLGDKVFYNKDFFEGDMLITAGDRNAVVKEHLLWPSGHVFYELSSSIEEIFPNVLKAMNEIENKTCIRFFKRTAETKDYVKIEELDGCWSAVGRQGEVQVMSLGGGCHFVGTILHELGHVIGLYHEHSRSDRDDYIRILWDNVEPGSKVQLLKMKPWEHNLLWEEFDYKSVMLYGEYAFSKDDLLPTIEVLEPGLVIGPLWKKEHLSASDVKRINRLYGCFGEEKPPPPKTPDYVCTFGENEDDCQLERLSGNLQMGITDFESRKVLLIEAYNASEEGTIFATPFVEVYGETEGCFSIEYFFLDKSVKHLNIFREDLEETLKIIGISPTMDNLQKWQKTEQSVLLPDFGLRFMVEIQTKNESGKIMFDNINFSFEPCGQNNEL